MSQEFTSSHPEYTRLSAANAHLFQPKMSVAEKCYLLRLIDYCLKDFPFPYTLATGTLIGAYHFKGFVPWDDDFDLYCFDSDQEAIKQTLAALPFIATCDYVSSFEGDDKRHFTKIFFKEGLIDFPEYSWSWPFIDIFWMTRDGDHLLVDRFNQTTFNTADFFPLKTAYFEDRLLNIPNKIETVLTRLYPTCLEYAMPSSYDHTHECVSPDFQPILVPYSDLKRGIASPLETLNQFPTHAFMLVADIGVTHSRWNVFHSVDAQLVTQTIMCPTPPSFDELEPMMMGITAQLKQVVSDLSPGASITKAVLAVAGPVNLTSGAFFDGEGPLIDRLQSLLEMPVSMMNRTDAFLAGEVFCPEGSLYQEKNALGLTLGTGVEGSVIWDNALLFNDAQRVREVGQMVYEPNGRRASNSKNPGCWESYVSAEGLFETTQALMNQWGDPVLIEQWSGLSPSESNHRLFAAALAKEEWAQHVVSKWHEDLTYGLVTLLSIWGPIPVILGGGLARWINVEALQNHVAQKLIFHPSVRQKLSIQHGTLGNDAALYGAGLANNRELFQRCS